VRITPARLVTPFRVAAAKIVAANWRIRQRLPRITALAVGLGLIKSAANGSRSTSPTADRPVRPYKHPINPTLIGCLFFQPSQGEEPSQLHFTTTRPPRRFYRLKRLLG